MLTALSKKLYSVSPGDASYSAGLLQKSGVFGPSRQLCRCERALWCSCSGLIMGLSTTLPAWLRSRFRNVRAGAAGRLLIRRGAVPLIFAVQRINAVDSYHA